MVILTSQDPASENGIYLIFFCQKKVYLLTAPLSKRRRGSIVNCKYCVIVPFWMLQVNVLLKGGAAVLLA